MEFFYWHNLVFLLKLATLTYAPLFSAIIKNIKAKKEKYF